MSVRSRPARKRAGLVAAALAFSGALAPATAQERITVRTEPGTPVIATRLLIATGPADEQPGEEGIAHLAARAVVRPIRPALDSLEARIAITPQKDALAFTLIAAPDAWAEASRLLLVALFRDRADSLVVVAERDAIEAQLSGRRHNPADAAMRAADAGFFGEAHPWGRPAVGDVESIAGITPARVRAHLEAQFTPDRAFVAVVGPIGPEQAREVLLRHLDASAPLPRKLIERRRPESSPVRADYNSVTTWVTVVYPFASAADVEAMRILAHLAAEELSFGPTRRAVYDMKSEVVVRPEAGEMRLTVVVPPEEADAWAERIQRVVAETIDDPRVTERWEETVRRYRGERLSQLAAPEDRAAAAAQALFVAGSTDSPIPDFETLTPARLGSALRSLGAPIVVFLGPFQAEDG